MSSFPESWLRPTGPKQSASVDTEDSGSNQPPPRPESSFTRGPWFWTALIIAAIVIIVAIASRVWTEILWFDQLGAFRVLWTRWAATGVLFLIAFLIQFAVVAFSANLAYRARPVSSRGATSANMRQYQQALEPFKKVAFLGIPALLAAINAAGVASNWQTFLVWMNRSPFGKTDPQFGLDVSFYVFTLPLLQVIASFLVSTLVLALIAIVGVNYLYGGISFVPRFSSTTKARRQVGIVAAVLSLAIGLRYLLGIYSLLLKSNEPVDGAMYTDIHATLPAQVILAVISVLVAALFLVAAFRGTWKLPAVGVAVTVVSALVIGGAYPALVQQFKVTPNERNLESTYIQRNIDATLAAYGLDKVEFENYSARTDATPGQLRQDSESTSQIRLLDPGIVSPTFRQLQQSRPYYTFANELAVDRYNIDGSRRDTVIAVRDINLNGLQSQQQTWVNQKTVFTHGFGVVAAFGNTVTSDGNPAFWEHSIPSQGDMGDYEPRVYFSPGSPEYSIVGAPEGADPQELDYPDENAASGQVMTTFSGNGGPSVGNPWNKLLYAVKFGSTDILFSNQTNSHSQILYNRDPLQRVAKVAPFLTLEQHAYPAVVDVDDDPSTPKRLVWVIDAYTTTDKYPYSEHQSLLDATTDSRTTEMGFASMGNINYMRNSVKATVDAYDGKVTLYAWDPDEPVLKAWSAVYPGMITDRSKISGDLMSHLRYPQDQFKVQRKLLETYHVTEASEFYTGGNRWRLSEDPTVTSNEASAATSQKLQPPYYLTMKMPTQDSAEFSLTSVYVPAGAGETRRAAMAGFLAVDSETGNETGKVRDGYGKLRLMALPSSSTVPGPGQVQNNFNTDNVVAQQLNLLSQQGSNVRRGNLLTLPVGGGLLYVQPVYVESTSSTSYPVLRYVLTAFGDKVGFGRTLAEALDQTFGGDSQATLGDDVVPSESVNQGDKGTTKTAEEQMNALLLQAQDAMKSADDALSKGDWAAYGKAQDKLSGLIEQMLSLQNLNVPADGGQGPQSGGDAAKGQGDGQG